MTSFTRNFLTKQMWHTRLLIALSSLTWAGLLFLPVDIFARKTYELMSKAGPEWLWGVLFMIHGIAAVWALNHENETPLKAKIRFVFDASLGMILWTSSTLLCFASHWPTQGDWIAQILNYPPPAAMSGELWVAIYSWIYFIFCGSDLIKDCKDE